MTCKTALECCCYWICFAPQWQYCVSFGTLETSIQNCGSEKRVALRLFEGLVLRAHKHTQIHCIFFQKNSKSFLDHIVCFIPQSLSSNERCINHCCISFKQQRRISFGLSLPEINWQLVHCLSNKPSNLIPNNHSSRWIMRVCVFLQR